MTWNVLALTKLPGNSVKIQIKPQVCSTCGSKHFYKQNDFRRSIGLTLVTIASILTFILNYFDVGWFWTWSPMLFFLFFDRILFYTSPVAVICYDCETIFRGLNKQDALTFDDFDLEMHDRIKYKERIEENTP
jgi:hypothetical protein